ncbi:MAG TPA: hypothetical protein VEZ70_09015 [Allosphingosinicella sp.]|nr:hypothetical protein [Allosphingosinicella sp.]
MSYKIADYKNDSQAAGACKQPQDNPLGGPREGRGKGEAEEEPGDEEEDGYLARCRSGKIADDANALGVRQLKLAAFNNLLGGLSTILAAWAIIAALIATRSDTGIGRSKVVPENPRPDGAGGGTRIAIRNLGPAAVYLRGVRCLALPQAPGPLQICGEVREVPEPMSVVLAARKKEAVLFPAEALPGQWLLVVVHYRGEGGGRHAWRLFERDHAGVYASIDYDEG